MSFAEDGFDLFAEDGFDLLFVAWRARSRWSWSRWPIVANLVATSVVVMAT